MRKFKSELPWCVRGADGYPLENAISTFRGAFADTRATEFKLVSSRTVYREYNKLYDRKADDLSVFELFLWLLDRRHFVMWQYAAEMDRDPALAARFRSTYETLWRETTRLARPRGRPMRRPDWPSQHKLLDGKYTPALLGMPLRVVDSRLMARASAEFNWRGFNLDMHAAARDIVASGRDYSKPPAAFEWMYESPAGPTLVAAPPTFPYRPKGVHTW